MIVVYPFYEKITLGLIHLELVPSCIPLNFFMPNVRHGVLLVPEFCLI